MMVSSSLRYEPRREKACHRDFLSGPTQIGLYKKKNMARGLKFGIQKQMDCTINVEKTMALISNCATDLGLFFRHMQKVGFFFWRGSNYHSTGAC